MAHNNKIACSLLLSLCVSTFALTWINGRSTYYSPIDGGNCGYGTISTTTFPYANIAAVNLFF